MATRSLILKRDKLRLLIKRSVKKTFVVEMSQIIPTAVFSEDYAADLGSMLDLGGALRSQIGFSVDPLVVAEYLKKSYGELENYIFGIYYD